MGGRKKRRGQTGKSKQKKSKTSKAMEASLTSAKGSDAAESSPPHTRLRSSSLDSAGASELRRRFSCTKLSDDGTAPSTSDRKRRYSVTEGPHSMSPIRKRPPRIVLSEEAVKDVLPVKYQSIAEEYEVESENGDSDADKDTSVFSTDGEVDCELENSGFLQMRKALNEETVECAAPPQLTETACRGIGTPSKVWNLLVRKDEVVRMEPLVLRDSVTPNTRAVLVDWMMEVCGNEKQHRETFHLSVDYLDRYLTADPTLSLGRLQCIGTTSLFLASKYEEIYPPRLETLVDYTDRACNDEQVRDTELIVLAALNWTLSAMTPVHWLNVYLQLLGNKEVVNPDEHQPAKPSPLPMYVREEYMHMAKVLDLAILDVDYHLFSYRELAAAVLFCCYEPLALVEEVTGYTYDKLLRAVEWLDPCVRLCEKNRAAGDPLPHVEDVRSDEWHNIQTHHGFEYGDAVFQTLREMRAASDKLTEKSRVSRRPPPLRPLCRNEPIV